MGNPTLMLGLIGGIAGGLVVAVLELAIFGGKFEPDGTPCRVQTVEFVREKGQSFVPVLSQRLGALESGVCVTATIGGQ